MSKGLFNCNQCKRLVVLHPPLSKRTGSNGPMTRAEALSLFRDSTSGMCNDCYIEGRNTEVPPPILQSLTLEALRDHQQGYTINSRGERIPFRAVEAWRPVE